MKIIQFVSLSAFERSEEHFDEVIYYSTNAFTKKNILMATSWSFNYFVGVVLVSPTRILEMLKMLLIPSRISLFTNARKYFFEIVKFPSGCRCRDHFRSVEEVCVPTLLPGYSCHNSIHCSWAFYQHWSLQYLNQQYLFSPQRNLVEGESRHHFSGTFKWFCWN